VTLTDLLPSLRTMIADPLDLDLWPSLTTTTPTDVVVGGVSLTRLADLCSTPCVHTADAVIPQSRGRRSLSETTTAVVVRVVSVTRHPQGSLLVTVDADLATVDAHLGEVRLLGRISRAHDVASSLTNTCRHDDARTPFSRLDAGLPDDLAVGDLLAFPCRGLVTLHQIRVGA
jgi:hypothetical protein